MDSDDEEEHVGGVVGVGVLMVGIGIGIGIFDRSGSNQRCSWCVGSRARYPIQCNSPGRVDRMVKRMMMSMMMMTGSVWVCVRGRRQR